jgi:uncharacterized phage protein (TIGR02218 family)
MRVERTDGVVQTFTSADIDVTVGGEIYEAATGLGISNLVVQANLAVDNMEIPVLPDEVSYPQVDIIAGLWDGALFWLFECDFTDPAIASGSAVGSATRTDINLLRRGTAGEAELIRVSRKFELRSLKQALQQPLGAVTSKTCRARLGDEKCRFDLDGSPSIWKRSYAVTTVTSRHVLAFSAALEVDDFYGEGIILSLTGSNSGYSRKIKSFSAGVVTLAMEMPFTVIAGDTFLLTAGCRKRRTEDCIDKFDNVLNFQGEPDVPGTDLLTADPEIGGS